MRKHIIRIVLIGAALCGAIGAGASYAMSDVELARIARQNQEKWRLLKEAMGPDEVRLYLGVPYKIAAGPVTTWWYQNNGSVQFQGGKVVAWSEPADFRYVPASIPPE